jgi:hypothetical protein
LNTQAAPRKRNFSVATAVVCGLAGYGLALAWPPSLYKLAFPTPVEAAPASDSPEGKALIEGLEQELQALPLVKQLREELLDETNTSLNSTSLTGEQVSKAKRWKEYRPYANLPESKKRHSLTHFSLRGPGKFAIPPILFASHDEKECIAVMHVGEAMCGHNGIVHGGLLATILDEAVARPVSSTVSSLFP